MTDFSYLKQNRADGSAITIQIFPVHGVNVMVVPQ